MKSGQDLASVVLKLADRQAIHDLIVNGCRAVDRLDRELLLSVYHPDAIEDHGLFVGNPQAFADWCFAVQRGMSHNTQHIVTNHVCELDGDTAHTETYWMVASMNLAEPPLSVCGGRYIDRFERRQGRWAIAARKCILDWSGQPAALPTPQSAMDAILAAGAPCRDRTDPSYRRPLQIDPNRVGYLFQGLNP